MTAEDIAETLGIARSNVPFDQGICWPGTSASGGACRSSAIAAINYEAETNIWEVAARIAARRKEREIDPPSMRCAPASRTPPTIRHQPVASKRLKEMLAFTELVDRPVRQNLNVRRPRFGRPDQARREDRQFSSDRQKPKGREVRECSMASSKRKSRDFTPILPATSARPIIDPSLLVGDADWGRLPLAIWRLFSSVMPTARPSSIRRGRRGQFQPDRLVARRSLARLGTAGRCRPIRDRCPDGRDGDGGCRKRRPDLIPHLRPLQGISASHHLETLAGRPALRNMSATASAWRCGSRSSAKRWISQCPLFPAGRAAADRAARVADAGRSHRDPFPSRGGTSASRSRSSSALRQAHAPVGNIPGVRIMTTLLWTLIAIQIVMVWSTVYHHELTERLAWRPSQRYELKLHGVRNDVCVSVPGVGWLEISGILAMVIIAVLVAEIVSRDGFCRRGYEPQTAGRANASTTRCSPSTTVPFWCCAAVLFDGRCSRPGSDQPIRLLSIIAGPRPLCGPVRRRDFAASRRLGTNEHAARDRSRRKTT